MNLVFLYGPPAAGKYTVGSIISKSLGYGFLHNHVTVDFVEGIFPFGTSRYRKLNKDLRLQIIKAAVRCGAKGLVMTYLFALDSKSDWREFEHFRRAATSHSGKMYVVELRCERNELFKRITDKSRRRFHKISSRKKLRKVITSHVFQSSDRFRAKPTTLVFDTTHASPATTAKRILQSLKLS
ncbi:MAG: AAA family ATPase [Parcubacteria group bacterium]